MRLLIAITGGFTTYLIVGSLFGTAPTFKRRHSREVKVSRLASWLTHVGSPLRPSQFVVASLAVGGSVWLGLSVAMGDVIAGFFPGLAASGFLAWTYERRRQQRLGETKEAWPDAIRHVLAFVRSGATVPMAVGSLATDGPPALREAFSGWADRARILGFAPALESIRTGLADPTADRVIEVLLIANEAGGELVTEVLSDLASEVGEDLRTERAIHAEGTTQRIEGWVVGVVPWALLVYLMGSQGEYRDFYQTGIGRTVIIGAGIWWSLGLTLLAYLRRNNQEPRVLVGTGPGQ